MNVLLKVVLSVGPQKCKTHISEVHMLHLTFYYFVKEKTLSSKYDNEIR